MMLGTTIRLAQMLGLERSETIVGVERPFDTIPPKDEYLKRQLFWTIFVLDRCVGRDNDFQIHHLSTNQTSYLSILLGRPIMIYEDDISLKFPEAIPGCDIDRAEIRLIPGTVAHIRYPHSQNQS